ncbi:MAG: Fic family protein [Erysipelotrichaceae bacterium]|nr:Fic family protein [Erysipelotrichaceae bacterium]
MNESYVPKKLPLSSAEIDQSVFMDELIDATAKLEVYKEKIKDSKLNSSWFMPTLQQKEALASSMMEGTQATLDGVLINQSYPNEKDKNVNEVLNYYQATVKGYDYLKKHDFSKVFFCDIHNALMEGNVRKPKKIGEYRDEQNYIGKNDPSHSITFVPPKPEFVETLMDNLIEYINDPKDKYRPLVRIAIIHAQFETIHPFMDGNGRVGRMLIPMYLFHQKQIELPCFFVSEALERDKIRYYTLLNNIRFKGEWNEWIKFFLSTVASQCEKYISIISKINALYDADMKKATDVSNTSSIVDVVNYLFMHPITNGKNISQDTGIPQSTVNRYLNILTECRMLYSDNKKKNRNYYYLDLLEIIR